MTSQNSHSKVSAWQRITASVLLFALCLLPLGCGDSASDDFVATGPQVSDGFFMGRVLLDDFAAGDEVVITDLGGQELYRLRTDRSGVFFAYGPLPSDFRITAKRPGETGEHRREVRGGYQMDTMYVNPLTTLASRYLENHPDVSLAQAEDWVRQRFQLPAGFDFDWVTNAKCQPFRPKLFYRAAAQVGGVESYYQSLISGGEPIVLVDDDDDILSITDSLFVNDGVSEVVGPVAKTESDGLLATIGKDVLGDGVSLVDAGIFGAVTQALGLNLGTTGALNAISMQLDEVLAELGELETAIGEEQIALQYSMDQEALTPIFTYFQQFNTSLSDAADGSGSPPSPTQDDFSTVRTYLATIGKYLIGDGENNFVFTTADYITNVSQQMKTGTSYLHYPVRNNALTNRLQNNLTTSFQYLIQGLNNRVELAHLSVPPAKELGDAVSDLDLAMQTIYQAKAQVPPDLSSDNLVLDLENSALWVGTFQPQQTYATARNIAQCWTEGQFEDFDLASRDTIEKLAQNRITNAKTDDSNEGWEAGFQRFGFNTDSYGEQFDQEDVGDNRTRIQGQSFMIDTGGINPQNVYQWSGVASTPATSGYGDISTSTFLIVHPIGVQAAYVESGYFYPFPFDPFAYCTLPESPALAVSVQGNQLSAQTAIGIPPFILQSVYTVGVTNRTYWSSSNPKMATVNNYPGPPFDEVNNNAGPDLGPQGYISWHPPINGGPLEPVTFTGTFWASSYANPGSLQAVSQSITVNPPSPAPVLKATSLQLIGYDPVRRSLTTEFDVSGLGTDSKSIDFYATAFYQDGQFVDASPDPQTGGTAPRARFEFLDPQGREVSNTSGFINSLYNRLSLSSSLIPGVYTIKATYTTQAGQTLTQTSPFRIDGNMAPVIPGIFPLYAFGPSPGPLLRFDANGTQQPSFTNFELFGGFQQIGFDPSGNLLIPSAELVVPVTNQGAISKVDPFTGASSLFFTVENTSQSCLLDGANNLLATSGGTVRRFDLTDPNPIFSFFQFPVSFATPRGLIRDTFGNVYVGDFGFNNGAVVGSGGIYAFDSQGQLRTDWGSNGRVAMNASQLALGSDGRLYFTEYLDHKVSSLDRNGSNYTTLINSTSITNPYGLAIDAAGNLYVNNAANGGFRISKFDRTGAVVNLDFITGVQQSAVNLTPTAP